MREMDCSEKVEVKTFLQIVYVICGLLVLYVLVIICQDRTFFRTSSKDQRLLGYNELKKQKNNLQVPDEWKFLEQNGTEQNHTRYLVQLNSDEESLESVHFRKQVAEDVAGIAETMREKNAELSVQPVSPLLKLEVMRKHQNQTYEPDDLQELGELEEMPVSVSGQDAGSRQSLSKPELESLSKPVDENHSESLDESHSKHVPSVANVSVENGTVSEGGVSSPVVSRSSRVHQRFQHHVRRCPMDQNSVEELLKYLEEVSEEIPVSEPKTTETPVTPKLPYNHEEGLEILRKFNKIARERLESYSRDVQDYALFLYKWDTTNSRLDGMDVMYCKLRENPYSIYALSIFPKRSEGREILYWEGHYDNQLIVNSGPKLWNRTLKFAPESAAIRSHSVRSVLNLGFRKLLEELIELSARPETFKNAEIRYYDQAKVGSRACYALEVTFPQKTPDETFYRIRIFVDRELTLPIQIVIYDWPEREKEPKVLESYTYVLHQMNPGFQDRDFCHLNPQYGFKTYIPDLSEQEAEFLNEVVPLER